MGVRHSDRVYKGDMKVIQVRNVPDEIHASLRRKAAEAGLSLSDYVLGELRLTAARGANAEVMIRAAERDAAVTTDDILSAVREGRRG